MRSETDHSSELERRSAIALRAGMLLLLGWVVWHKVFPLDLLGMPLSEITLPLALLGLMRAIAATAAAVYILRHVGRISDSLDRTRLWCELWISMALGTMTLLTGAVSVVLLERKGVAIAAGAHWISQGILWLLI